MGTVKQLGKGEDLDCATMLMDAASEAGDYTAVAIVCLHKDGERVVTWTTNSRKNFLWQASHTLAELSMKEIISEE